MLSPIWQVSDHLLPQSRASVPLLWLCFFPVLTACAVLPPLPPDPDLFPAARQSPPPVAALPDFSSFPVLPDAFLTFADGVPFNILVSSLYSPAGFEVVSAGLFPSVSVSLSGRLSGRALSDFLTTYAAAAAIHVSRRDKTISLSGSGVQSVPLLLQLHHVPPDVVIRALSFSADDAASPLVSGSAGAFADLRVSSLPHISALLFSGLDAPQAYQFASMLDQPQPVQRVLVQAHFFDASSVSDFSYSIRSVLESALPELATGGLFSFTISSGDFHTLGSIVSNASSVRVFASPRALLNLGEEASFSAGSSIPTLGGETTTTTGTSSSVVYQDAGVSLSVRVDRSAAGLFRVVVSQSLSSPSRNTLSGLDSPIFSTSAISSTLTFRDGEAVILGGMDFEQDDNSADGFFFGRGESKTRRRLFVILQVSGFSGS